MQTSILLAAQKQIKSVPNNIQEKQPEPLYLAAATISKLVQGLDSNMQYTIGIGFVFRKLHKKVLFLGQANCKNIFFARQAGHATADLVFKEIAIFFCKLTYFWDGIGTISAYL